MGGRDWHERKDNTKLVLSDGHPFNRKKQVIVPAVGQPGSFVSFSVDVGVFLSVQMKY